jgi:hypothetical protein
MSPIGKQASFDRLMNLMLQKGLASTFTSPFAKVYARFVAATSVLQNGMKLNILIFKPY